MPGAMANSIAWSNEKSWPSHHLALPCGLRKALALVWYRHGGQSWSGPDPKGGGYPPPSTDPKMVVQDNGFCGRRRFCFRHMAGGNFLFDPMYLYSKYSEFCGEIKNG